MSGDCHLIPLLKNYLYFEMQLRETWDTSKETRTGWGKRSGEKAQTADLKVKYCAHGWKTKIYPLKTQWLFHHSTSNFTWRLGLDPSPEKCLQFEFRLRETWVTSRQTRTGWVKRSGLKAQTADRKAKHCAPGWKSKIYPLITPWIFHHSTSKFAWRLGLDPSPEKCL